MSLRRNHNNLLNMIKHDGASLCDFKIIEHETLKYLSGLFNGQSNYGLSVVHCRRQVNKEGVKLLTTMVTSKEIHQTLLLVVKHILFTTILEA